MQESPWVNTREASTQLGVSEKVLKRWCELEYLKEGTHWKKHSPGQTLRKIIFLDNSKLDIYFHVSWCKEEMNYWESRDAAIYGEAA